MQFHRVLKWNVRAVWMWTLAATLFADAGGQAVRKSQRINPQPALLGDALSALLEGQGRWAFTETRQGVQDGKAIPESIARIDPSMTYAEQYKPVRIRGKAATEKQLKEAAERGERAAKRRAEQQQKSPRETAEKNGPTGERGREVEIYINGQRITPAIDMATVADEDEASVTFAVPLRMEASEKNRELFEKFELTARVGKNSHQFEHAVIRQREPMRVKLVAKVSDTVLEFQFGTPVPGRPAVVTKIAAQGHVRILLGHDRAIQSEVVRTDFKWVTPYDERFGVKMGATRTIEF